MKTNTTHIFCCVLILIFASQALFAQNHLVGLKTDGSIYEIDQKTGSETKIAEESITNFTLGGIARRKNLLYYVTAPSGSSENSIYKLNTRKNVLTKIDLDRSLGDDDLRALFFDGRRLYGIFYNGTASTAGLYLIKPKTGKTVLKIDLSDLNLEPIGGGFVRRKNFTYVLTKPESDNSLRKLLRFKRTARSVRVFDVKDSNNNPVLCERIQVIANQKKLVCLASAAEETQVNYCNLKFRGVANCVSTLLDIKSIAGGHTFTTLDGKNFFALVYKNSDSDNNQLLKINKFGNVVSSYTMNGIYVGVRFRNEEK